MVRDDATPPLPEALLGLQLWRVGGRGLEDTPTMRCTDNSLDGSPLLLVPAVMDHPQPLAWMGPQPGRQALRDLPLAPRGADLVVSPAAQGGHRTRDVPLRMVVPARARGAPSTQAPLGGQRRMAAHRGRSTTPQLPVLRPLRQPRRQCAPQGCRLCRLGSQVPRAPPTPAESPRVPPRPAPLPAGLEAQAGRAEGPDQRGRPHAQVRAQRSGTAAARLVALGPWRRRESGRPPRDQCALQPLEPALVASVHPTAKGLFLPRPPRRKLGAVLAIAPPQHAVVPLAQPDSVRRTKGEPDVSACPRGSGPRHQRAGPPGCSLIPQGLKNREYFVGSL
jgi:hypothetical protein